MDKSYRPNHIPNFLREWRKDRLWWFGRGNLRMARQKDFEDYPNQGRSLHHVWDNG